MGYQEIDLETWPRKEHYLHFTKQAKCFVSITKDVDVTQLRAAAKTCGRSFYIAFLYVICKVINRHSEFKLAYLPEEEKLVQWDEVLPSHLVFHEEDETFTCIWSRWEPDFEVFYRGCQEDIAAGKEYRGYRVPGMPENTFCVSCLPWIKYSALDINLCGDGLFLAPMISWGKAELDGGRMRMPLSFEIHHGAADGFHIARFYDEVEQEAAALAEYLSAFGGKRTCC